MRKHLLATIGLLLAILAVGQTAAPAATSVDPDRLKAAQALIDQIFPPATRQQMIQAMMAPMLANMRQAITQNPQFAKALGDNPRVKALFDEFMERQINRSTDALRTGLPGMTDAMARAYARRFDTRQLGEIATFFATPTGRMYMAASMSIMSDPDIAAWQRRLMTETMGHVQEDSAEFARKVAALTPEPKKP